MPLVLVLGDDAYYSRDVTFAPGTLARLRRTGVSFVGGIYAGRVLRSLLQEQDVRVTVHLGLDAAASSALRHPYTPVFLFDGNQLDNAARFVALLEDAVRATRVVTRPPVFIVTPHLDRGLAELGWSGSTHRVAFIRAQHLVHDVGLALADCVSSEPEPPKDPLLSSSGASSDQEPTFGVARLGRELEDRLSWLGVRWERVRSSYIARVVAPDHPDVEATLQVGWRDAAGSAFAFGMDGSLLRARGMFSARVAQGLRGAFERLRGDVQIGDQRFDDAYLLDADAFGLEEARGVRELLRRCPGHVESLCWTEDAFTARAECLAKDELLPVVDVAVQIWRQLVRTRLGH